MMGREDWTPVEIEAEEKYVKEGLMAEYEMTEQEAEELVSPFEWANEETLNRMIALLKITSRLAQRRLMAHINEPCTGHITPSGKFRGLHLIPRHLCLTCIEQLRKEVGLE